MNSCNLIKKRLADKLEFTTPLKRCPAPEEGGIFEANWGKWNLIKKNQELASFAGREFESSKIAKATNLELLLSR